MRSQGSETSGPTKFAHRYRSAPVHPTSQAQATCTLMATAASNENLWRELYSRLPRVVRSLDESGLSLAGAVGAGSGAESAQLLHPKTLFARVASAAASSRAVVTAERCGDVRRRLGAIHHLKSSVGSLKADLAVRLNGQPARAVQTKGPRAEAWVSRPSLLAEPSVGRKDGVRAFALSSSVKVEAPAAAGLETAGSLRSLWVALSWSNRGYKNAAALLPRMTSVARIEDDRPFLSRARRIGASADDGAVVLYERRIGDGGGGGAADHIGGRISNRDRTTAVFPVTCGCTLVGVLPPSHRRDGTTRDSSYSSSCDDDGGLAFITVHLPHDLVLDVATREDTGDGSGARVIRHVRGGRGAGPRYDLEDLTVGMGLRTTGVPLWERASKGLRGRILEATAGDANSRRAQPPKDGEQHGSGVVCLDVLRAGESTGDHGAAVTLEERELSSGPGLPFSTPGGLSGVVADVLLADFTLCGPEGISMWAFTLPIVFEACVDAGAGGAAAAAAAAAEVPRRGGGGGGDDNDDDFDDTIDMAHKEVREERRRGVVTEPGVGRVIVELSLVESPGEDGDGGHHERARVPSGTRCPAGHAWIVRSARVELELGFVNAVNSSRMR